MQLSYFLPNETLDGFEAAWQQKLRAAGIAESLVDVRRLGMLARCEVKSGPGGFDGLVIAPLRADDGEPPELLGYFEDRQTWVDPFDQGKVWIGWQTDAPPTPEDLRRTTPLALPGYELELANGQTWHVPVISSQERLGALHQRLTFDASGKARAAVAARHESLWEESAEIADAYFVHGRVDWSRVGTFCARCLGLNYRVSVAEQNVLGIFELAHVSQLLDALFDRPQLNRLLAIDDPQKKTGSIAESPAISPGSRDSTPATGLAVAN